MRRGIINTYRLESINQYSFATGFVRPKSTALFFKKIWAPYDIRQSHYGRKFDMCSIPEEICLLGRDIENRQLFERMERRLNRVMEKGSKLDLKEEDELSGFREMLLSENRNKALLHCSKVFKNTFGINMIPILVDKTRYETDIARLNRNIARNREDSKVEEATVIELTIRALPMAIEEKMDWQQVVDFRNDKNEVEKLRRFLLWSNNEFVGKSKDQIQNELGELLDNYKFALKKHGIETVTSGITTVMASSSTVLQVIGDLQSAGLAVGLTVSAGLITYFVNSYMQYSELKHDPIAYIYDVVNETNNWWSKRR